jgi:hypothetical protein
MHSWYVRKYAYIHVYLVTSSAGLISILYFLAAFGSRTMSVLRLMLRTLRFRGKIFTEPLPSRVSSIYTRMNNSSVVAYIFVAWTYLTSWYQERKGGMHFTESLSSTDRRDIHIDKENSVIYEQRRCDRLRCHGTYIRRHREHGDLISLLYESKVIGQKVNLSLWLTKVWAMKTYGRVYV